RPLSIGELRPYHRSSANVARPLASPDIAERPPKHRTLGCSRGSNRLSAAEVRRSDCLPPRRARSGERPGRRLSTLAEDLPVGGSARQRTAAGVVVSYRKTRGVPAS